MKGCNTLTLCPAQMHEAVEFWLKNQVLRAEHAAGVKVVDVRRKAEAGACYGFEIELREKEAPQSVADYINKVAEDARRTAPERLYGPVNVMPCDGVVGD